MTAPMYSVGVRIEALMIGSRISAIVRRVGHVGRVVDLDVASPSVSVTSNDT